MLSRRIQQRMEHRQHSQKDKLQQTINNGSTTSIQSFLYPGNAIFTQHDIHKPGRSRNGPVKGRSGIPLCPGI
jgi:hypothetical protein